jgi:hypothetical protein
MALIQAARVSTSGGGIVIEGFQVDLHTQETNFISGGVVIALSQTPVSTDAIVVDYNGQRLLFGSSWSYAAGSVTILFADPYVTDYDTPPVFQITYPY